MAVGQDSCERGDPGGGCGTMNKGIDGGPGERWKEAEVGGVSAVVDAASSSCKEMLQIMAAI